MSASTDIIERIKKLLRLARSSNPNESAQALRRAMELAAEHDVNISGLNPDDAVKEKAVIHQDSDPFARLNYDQRYALAIVRAFFRVSTVEVTALHVVKGWPRAGVRIMYVGTSSDIEIARYIFGFITYQFAFCWRTLRGRFRNRHAYVHGMYQGIFRSLLDKMPPADSPAAKGNEIVLQEHRNYITAVIGKTTMKDLSTPDSRAQGAAWAGFQQGRKTQINSALKPSVDSTLALQ